MYELCLLRRSEGYEVCADEVRVETCGKSARIGVEASVAVNSIRSNTVSIMPLCAADCRKLRERSIQELDVTPQIVRKWLL